MKLIKFSHWYTKFNGVLDDFKVRDQRNTAKLLLVLKTTYLELNKFFLEYDTSYGDNQYYPLPKTDLIILIFKSDYSGKIFPTIRYYNPEKLKYYKSSIGERFQIIIEP